MRGFALASSLLVAASCGPGRDPDFRDRQAENAAGLGRCTQEEPGTLAKTGQAVYVLDRTPTTSDAPVGRYAIVLTCLTQGPAGSSVTLVLPNLTEQRPAPGRYRIQAPGVVPARTELARLAWAEAALPAENGVAYRGMGGELVLDPAGDADALVGSYLVAFERAAEAPGIGPARLVIGGAFAAPRNRLPKQAPAAGTSR
jgi:hypothetical protein